MRDTEAIGLIGSMCLRMFGLLVVIAECVVPRNARDARKFVKSQREWLSKTQDMLELEQTVNDAFAGDAE